MKTEKKLHKCPSCGYHAYTGTECHDCGYPHSKSYTGFLIVIFILLVGMMSCSSPDCTNGIQDGDETGIDCGGECPYECPSATDELLYGEWYLDFWYYQPVGNLQTYAANTACKVNLTFDIHASSGHYTAEGALDGCTYNTESVWWTDGSGTTLNGTYNIVTLTADSLVFKSVDNMNYWHYYR